MSAQNLSAFCVYLLNSSSGRDKLLGICENIALAICTSITQVGGEQWVRTKLLEKDLSQCRKGFRLAKTLPDFARCTEAIWQSVTDARIGVGKRIQLVLEAAGTFSSGMYFVYDNTGWAVNVGLLQGNVIPRELETFVAARSSPNYAPLGKTSTVSTQEV